MTRTQQKPLSFLLIDTMLYIFINKPGYYTSATGIACAMLHSSDINYVKRRKSGNDQIVTLKDNNNRYLDFHIHAEDAQIIKLFPETKKIYFEAIGYKDGQPTNNTSN